MIGTVYTELAVHDHPRYAGHAIAALSTAVAAYGDPMRRSRVFCRTMLALDHLIDGDLDHAADVATHALEDAGRVASARVADRMRPLHARLDQHHWHPQLTEVLERMDRIVKPRN
jgi:hypothetical protein